jgi:hypothetical protein
MTKLTVAARNLLAQDPDVRDLLGASKNWDTWVFADLPMVRLENKGTSLIVITENGSHDRMNQYNTLKFPRLFVDIWSDPSRNSDNSVQIHDADSKIEEILNVINHHFHLVNPDVPEDAPAYFGKKGQPRFWGTSEQITDRTGVMVTGSSMIDGPEYSDVSGGNGARMGRITYGVNHA